MEKITALIMSFITMLLSLFGMDFGSKKYEKFTDISYDTHERSVVNIYVPDGATKKSYNACILYIHGGSWSDGDKSDMKSMCEEYVNKGYITATMSYRLHAEGNGITAIDMLEDIDNCIKRIKTFSDENGLNIQKICTSGYSSGAHISMLYNYAYTNPEKDGVLNFINPAIPIVFTANRVGPTSFHEGVWVNSAFSKGDIGVVLAQELSGVALFEEENGEIKYITDETTRNNAIDIVSPVSHLTKEAVPSLFGYGGKDTIVPKGNKDAIISKCDEIGVKYDLVMYPNSNHALLSDSDSAAEYTKLFDEYCLTYFGY